jgi:hypothetical protein
MREQMRVNLSATINVICPQGPAPEIRMSDQGASTGVEALGGLLRGLSPSNESQQFLKTAALQTYGESARLRWTLIQRAQTTIPTVFLVVLVFWFTLLFAVFALLTPGNMTVNVVLFFSALSITGGIMLVLDLNRPFEGIVKVSSAPLVNVLAGLGK